jgi:alkylated DNA repair dioxygenase AlkB
MGWHKDIFPNYQIKYPIVIITLQSASYFEYSTENKKLWGKTFPKSGEIIFEEGDLLVMQRELYHAVKRIKNQAMLLLKNKVSIVVREMELK